MVTVLDSATGKEIKQPINEIASSHMARRTFIGNLYRRVKDPNLIGKLSGHVEGSKAFARYRDIDKEHITTMKQICLGDGLKEPISHFRRFAMWLWKDTYSMTVWDFV